MRGLLKRGDLELQASVASTHQVLLGSCLTAHASGASLSLGELPLRMHMCAMRMSLYLDVYCPVEPHQTPRRSFVGGMLHSPPHLSQPRCRALPLIASSSCFPRPQLGLPALHQYIDVY